MARKLKIPCACGGHLESGFTNGYDATTVLGHGVVVEGRVPGMVCRQCGAFAPTGDLLDGRLARARGPRPATLRAPPTPGPLAPGEEVT